MNVLVLGGTSDIARAFALKLASPEDQFLLAARSESELEIVAADLKIRTGAAVQIICFDAENRESYQDIDRRFIERLGTIDGVLLAFGYLGEQQRAESDDVEASRIIEVNLTGAISMMEPLAAYFEERGSGWILGLSSVAGVRGRRSNYIYGAAKSGLTTYLEGLAHRLSPRGVRVKIAKIGFVASKMTRGLPMPPWAVADPQSVARSLVWLLRSPIQSAFIPWRWWLIMAVIRLLPAYIFNRTRL